MKEEQVRDELKKTCQAIIIIGKAERLPIGYLRKMQETIEKELAGSLDVLKAPTILIEEIKAKVRNSNQHSHKRQETIRHIEKLRDQSIRLIGRINYGHVDSGKRRGKF